MECTLCPRRCKTDRSIHRGACAEGDGIRVSKVSLHYFEEPPISGTNGSGTVFFSGCPLRCVFCQNRDISRGDVNAIAVDVDRLVKIFFELEERGAHNINLVTPTHFANKIASALEIAKPKLKIPVVYNSSGYENIETLRMLDGLVDVYLPDMKYASSELAAKYSSAPDYPEIALAAIAEMYSQVGKYEYGEEGMLKKGVVIRHLVLPKCRKDSMNVLRMLSDALPVGEVLLSLMSQYTPEFVDGERYPELNRRVTTFEYNSVLEYATSLGFDGFMQGRDSATKAYTPSFL